MAKIVLVVAIVFCSGLSAETSLNAMCYLRDTPGEVPQGRHMDELFELASVSKLAVSYWAIKTLGPEFRFDTRIYVVEVGDQIYDIHLQGARDPFWGRHLTHLLFAELNRLGVHEIRSFSFDEHFKTRWSVLTDFVHDINPSSEEIRRSLELHLKNIDREYAETLLDAKAVGIELPSRVLLKVGKVEYIESSQFQLLNRGAQQFSLKSTPLYRYIKEMNRISNNHVADKLYEILGGDSGFRVFIDNNISPANIRFINGSGNAVVVGYDQRGRVVKEYNKASCSTVVAITKSLRDTLRASSSLDLKDVMAVSSSDISTLSPSYDGIPNSLIAKTGTVDPTVALAGLASAVQGDVYFGILYRTESAADWGAARRKVREMVFNLFDRFGGTRELTYKASSFLPFDQHSGLVAVSQSESQDQKISNNSKVLTR